MEKQLTLSSLFDGIGGWLLAAKHNGIQPMWSSEIDPYPAAVSKFHFPNVIQYGDVTKINGADVEPTDILCAGSPCQGLSVAGKRKGLNDERSGLFMEAIRIMREMREKTNGQYPKYFVWENVPGAFTSNRGQDFRAVLEEITESTIPMPASGRWAGSGMVRSQKCAVCWRVLDSQWWGVPQRRKRVFLIADFTKTSRGEILFEPKSLLGNSSKSTGTWEGTPSDVGTGVEKTSERADRLIESDVMAYSLASKHSNGMLNSNPYSGCCSPAKIARTLDTTTPDPTKNQGGILVYALQGNMINRKTENGPQGTGINENKCFTLNTIDRHAIAPIGFKDTNNKTIRRLTPVECERLQGLPDGYTNIEFEGKAASDAKRYKALGNGMAQPCADFVLQCIVRNEAPVR